MSLREFFFENFAGDLEYHPRRAALYLVLAVAAAAFWFFSAAEAKFSATPLVFVLGALTLLTKGIFLLRRSSEGLGLYQSDLAALSDPANRKQLPSIPALAAQILQDFGAGSLLLWPLLNVGKDINQSWTDPPRLQVFAAGAALFLLGWTIRPPSNNRDLTPPPRPPQASTRLPHQTRSRPLLLALEFQECSKGKGGLTQNDAKRIFAHILEPELARLRIQANTIRRAGIKKAAAKTVASFAAVRLGVYGGLLPSDLASPLEMTGGIGLLSQVGESVGLIERNPAEIES